MKIGLVVEQFDPLRGGLEQWSHQFAAQLLDRGNEVHVVAGRFGDSVEGMPLVPHRLEGVRSRIGFARAAEGKLRSLDLDVIHDMGAGWYCDVFQPHGGSRLVAMDRNERLSPPWLRPWKRRVNPWLPRYRQFTRLMARQYVDDGRVFLALSGQTADDFERVHGVPKDQIRLVYNGVDSNRFSPDHRARYRRSVRSRLGVDDGTLLLLIVAHNFSLKGVPALLKAMGLLVARRRPVHLAVVGGKHLGPWERLARRPGLAGSVTFAGPVRDTVPFYAAADVYVHPTFHDPCSLVALEALASGLPVLTSRVNGVSELMTDGREGFLLDDAADVEGLVKKLEPLFDSPLHARMGIAARRLALARSLDRNVDEILHVYDEVLRSRADRGLDAARRARRPFVVHRVAEERAPSASAQKHGD